MADFISGFSSGLGSALSGVLAGLILNGFTNNDTGTAPNYYDQQKEANAKRQAELDLFVDKSNLAQTNLIKNIQDNNDLLERKYDEERKQKLDSTKKRLATIRAYAGLHGTGGTNAIHNQLERINQQTDDSLKDLTQNTQQQINTNTNKLKNFIDKQKLDYKGLLI